MYIKNYFSYKSDSKLDKEYKSMLKELTALDTRKISKLNLLALYGATSTLRDREFYKDLSIYIATHYACINETYKVLKELKEQNQIMPFDFLNINTNNMGFYINKALGSLGNSYSITSGFLSFEKAIHCAFLEYKNRNNYSFLVGNVDASTQNITHSKDLIQNQDISTWIYFDHNNKDAVAMIGDVQYFSSIDMLNMYLKIKKYDTIFLNQFAYDIHKLLDVSCEIALSASLVDCLSYNFNDMLFISMDNKQRGYLFYITKDEV